MNEIAYYRSKVAECLRLVGAHDDPLLRDVYRAMAEEFADKLAETGHDARAEATLELADV